MSDEQPDERCARCHELTRAGRCCEVHDRIVCSACRGVDSHIQEHRA